MIPTKIERRARWVLDTIGATNVGFGDDVPYDAEAWAAVEAGRLPVRDDLATAFFHLSRREELDGPRDTHGRFPSSASSLDPLDPPLERLRRKLGVEPPRWGDARFVVALSHDVDVPWRWTPIGIRGGMARLKRGALALDGSTTAREARALSGIPMHRLRGTDPNWRFDRILRVEKTRGARSTFFVMGGHGHPADGPAPARYEELRPRLVETLLAGDAEIGLHGSYAAADEFQTLKEEKAELERLAGPLEGQRYHYLRVSPERNLRPLDDLGFRYDTSMAFADAPGFRAGIAHPFRPWDHERDEPMGLVEVPLALMDVTLSEDRYMGLSAGRAEAQLLRLVDWAAFNGSGFAVLWHTDRFDPSTSRGWDRLYLRMIQAVRDRGGTCVSVGELAREADEWLS